MRIDGEREGMLLEKAAVQREFQRFESETIGYQEQTKYTLHAKKRLERSIADEALEHQQAKDKFDEFTQEKKMMLNDFEEIHLELGRRKNQIASLKNELDILERQIADQEELPV